MASGRDYFPKTVQRFSPRWWSSAPAPLWSKSWWNPVSRVRRRCRSQYRTSYVFFGQWEKKLPATALTNDDYRKKCIPPLILNIRYLPYGKTKMHWSIFPHNIVWGSCFWFCMPSTASSSSSSSSSSLSQHNLSHTTLSHTNLSHTIFHTTIFHTTILHTTTFSHTIFHTQLCHATIFHTHNFVTLFGWTAQFVLHQSWVTTHLLFLRSVSTSRGPSYKIGTLAVKYCSAKCEEWSHSFPRIEG